MKKNKSNGGFTLVELLVVIAIISFMSSIVFASLQSARVKAQDAAQIDSLREFKTALELYHADYGVYPKVFDSFGNQKPFVTSTCSAGGLTGDWATLAATVVPTYIKSMPRTQCPPGLQPKYTYFTSPWSTSAGAGDGNPCELTGSDGFFLYENGTAGKYGTSDTVRANDGGFMNGGAPGYAYELRGGTTLIGTMSGGVCVPF